MLKIRNKIFQDRFHRLKRGWIITLVRKSKLIWLPVYCVIVGLIAVFLG